MTSTNCTCGELPDDCCFPNCDAGDKEKKCKKTECVLVCSNK